MKVETVFIKSEFIKLDQFLKLSCVTSSGSEAKILIAAGKILVNEEIETRRGRKLIPGDIVMTSGHSFLIKKETPSTSCS